MRFRCLRHFFTEAAAGFEFLFTGKIKLLTEDSHWKIQLNFFPSTAVLFLGYTVQGLELVSKVELVSKELNHFGVIAGLFRQIGGHSSRFVLFYSF